MEKDPREPDNSSSNMEEIKHLKYEIVGSDCQIISIQVPPKESIYLNESSVISFSPQFKKISMKKKFFQKKISYTHMDSEFFNESNAPAKISLSEGGGKIHVLNKANLTNMIINENFVLAHTKCVHLYTWTNLKHDIRDSTTGKKQLYRVTKMYPNENIYAVNNYFIILQ